MDLLAVRGVCLLPLVAALAWAGTRLYSATYAELLMPSNLAVPLFVRAAEGAADAVVVVVLVWLVTETVAALAVRHMILAGESAARSIAAAVIHVVRRPLSTALTLGAWTLVSTLAVATAMAVTAQAFEWCLVAARNSGPVAITLGLGPFTTTRDFQPIAFGLTAFVLSAAWLCAAALSGIASAWRSAAWTEEVAAELSSGSASGESSTVMQ